MNNLIILCLIILMFIRSIGLGVSIGFFYDTRDVKFLLFMLGWILWISATIYPLFLHFVIDKTSKDILLFLNILSIAIGSIFYIWGISKYVMNVSVNVIFLILIVSIILPLILFLTGNVKLALMICLLIFSTALFCSYIILPLKKKDFKTFKTFIGKSIRWYYAIVFIFSVYIPILIIYYFLGYSFGLYDAEDPILIMVYYIPIIGGFILIIVLLIHLEYSISSLQKKDLKDKYSHDLGNVMQAILTAYELIKGEMTRSESRELDKLLESKILEASRLIKEIREL